VPLGRLPGLLFEDDGIVLGDSGTATTELGEFRNNSGQLVARDSSGEFNLRASGSLTPSAPGQIAYSVDGVSVTMELPVIDGATGQLVIDGATATIVVVG